MIVLAFWAMGFYWVVIATNHQPSPVILDFVVSILIIDHLILWLSNIESVFFERKD